MTTSGKMLLVAALAITFASSTGQAKLLITREDAIVVVYGDSAVAKTKTIYLTKEQKEYLEQQAQAKLERRRVTYYEITVGDSLVGLAFVDKHVVRSLSETILIALDSTGAILAVEILAWNEPDDFMPSARWLDQAKGEQDIKQMRTGEGMPQIAGATLSTRAITAALRRALVMGRQVLFPLREN